jgi:hypothetical protein
MPVEIDLLKSNGQVAQSAREVIIKTSALCRSEKLITAENVATSFR